MYDYFGNTTLRVNELLFNIEKQLQLLQKVFEEHSDLKWKANGELQNIYANKLIEEGLLTSQDDKKAKIARQKTSPLEDFGLIRREQTQITTEGYQLLELLKQPKLKNDFLQIEMVSLFFLVRFFHLQKTGEDSASTFKNYLSIFMKLHFSLHDTEFELLPLYRNFTSIDTFVDKIQQIRENNLTKRNLIITILKDSSEYTTKLQEFKSDYPVHKKFTGKYFDTAKGSGSNEKILSLLRLCEKIHHAHDDAYIYFHKIMTNGTSSTKDFYKKHINYTGNSLPFRKINWKKIFLHFSHYIKEFFFEDVYQSFFYFIYENRIVANLNDYSDLNRRYLNLTDCFVFEGNQVSIIENLQLILKDDHKKTAFTLLKNLEITPDSLNFLVEEERIQENLKDFGIPLENVSTTMENLRKREYNLAHEKLSTLMKTRFSIEKLTTDILPLFEDRSATNDKSLQDKVSKEASIPTIFEYIIAVAFAHIYKNPDIILNAGVSLDNRLLPKSHATGLQADIVIDSPDYSVVVEVTLTKSQNQRRAEMEPVTRHLGNKLLDIHGEKRRKSFGIFIAPYLDKNVLNDFRSRRTTPFERNDDYILGMNILPLNIKDLIHILRQVNDGLSEVDLYKKSQKAFVHENNFGSRWYKNVVVPLFQV